MGKNKHSKSFEIALSGISCAIAAGALAMGILSGYFVATGYCIGILALMLPLSKQFYKGGALAYLGTVILAVVLGASIRFWDLVPFAMFFGVHPLVNALQVRYKINRWLAFIVKALWFDGTLIAAYFLVFGGEIYGSVLPQAVYDVLNSGYLYLIIFTLGTAVFFVYDYFIFKCQIAVNMAVRRIRK